VKIGGSGNDWLDGSSGTDYLNGGNGDDTLSMGGSLGVVDGDTYLFNRGDGQDSINDYGASVLGGVAGIDRIVFGSGIAVGDIAVSRVGANLVLNINNPGNPAAVDRITVENWDNSLYRIEQVQFANGAVLSAAQLGQMATEATAGSDTINMWSDMSSADGLGGDDTIVAGGAGVTVHGGTGNDTIRSDFDGSDFLYGDAGDDVITTLGFGTRFLSGGDGNDTINFSSRATNTIEGGAGDDLIQRAGTYYYAVFGNTFTGGAGNDRIISGAGADTYIFNRGDGQDSIMDVSDEFYVTTDKIVLGAGIGGDLAYQYAKSGNLSDVSMAPAQALLAGASFGTGSQSLQPTGALQDSSPRLL
jgi:Ca2+-binding RTX toxin-like protein